MADGVTVKLTKYELLFAAQVGVARRIRNRSYGSRHRWGYTDTGDGWGADIDAASAELAVAKFLGGYWSGAIGRDADVGDDIQVRQTRHDHGCLLIHADDRDDHVFVLAIGTDGEFRLVGCKGGSEAKRAEWLDSKRPDGECYFVPQDELESIDELRL